MRLCDGLSSSTPRNSRNMPRCASALAFADSLVFRSSFSLTPKWNFSSNGYYDINSGKLTGLSLAINRDMHCWQLSIGLTPVGLNRYFSFTISPKSGLLQNLKINRTRTFMDF